MADVRPAPLSAPIPYTRTEPQGGPLGYLGDIGVGAGAGVLDILGGVAAGGANIAAGIGANPQGEENLRKLTELTNYAADYVRQQMSDKGKERMGRSWIPGGEQPSAWSGGPLETLATLGQQAAGVAGPIAATIKAPYLAPVIWGGTTAVQLQGETAREIDNSTDAELRSKYPEYAAQRASGTSERAARSALAQKRAGVLPTAIAAGTGAASGVPIAGALMPAAAPLWRRAATGAAEGLAAGAIGGGGYSVAKQQGEVAAGGQPGIDWAQAGEEGLNLALMGVVPGAIASAVSKPRGGTKTHVPPELEVAMHGDLDMPAAGGAGMRRLKSIRSAPVDDELLGRPRRDTGRMMRTGIHEPTADTWKFISDPYGSRTATTQAEREAFAGREPGTERFWMPLPDRGPATRAEAGLDEFGIGEGTLGGTAPASRGRLPRGERFGGAFGPQHEGWPYGDFTVKPAKGRRGRKPPPDDGGGTPPPDDTGPPDDGSGGGVPPATPAGGTPSVGPFDALPPVPTQGAYSNVNSATANGPAVYTNPQTGRHEQVVAVPERDPVTGRTTEPRSEIMDENGQPEVVRTILIEDAEGNITQQTVRARDLEMVPDYVLAEMESDPGALQRWLANRPRDPGITPAEPPAWTPPRAPRTEIPGAGPGGRAATTMGPDTRVGRRAGEGYRQLDEIVPTERYTHVSTEERPVSPTTRADVFEGMVPYEGAVPRDVPYDRYVGGRAYDPGGVRTEMVRGPDGSWRPEPDRRGWRADTDATLQEKPAIEPPPLTFAQRVAALLPPLVHPEIRAAKGLRRSKAARAARELMWQERRLPPTAAKFFREEPPAAGPRRIRLYRVHTTGRDGRMPEPDWLRQAASERGILGATGRWFTSDPAILDWYIHHHGGPSDRVQLRYIDLPIETANQYRVSNLGPDRLRGADDPRSYSLDPDVEFFLSRGQAIRAKKVPVEMRDGVPHVMGVAYEGRPAPAAVAPKRAIAGSIQPQPYREPVSSGRAQPSAVEAKGVQQGPGVILTKRETTAQRARPLLIKLKAELNRLRRQPQSEARDAAIRRVQKDAQTLERVILQGRQPGPASPKAVAAREMAARKRGAAPEGRETAQRPVAGAVGLRTDPVTGLPSRGTAPVQRAHDPYSYRTDWTETTLRKPTEREIAAGADPNRLIAETRDLGATTKRELDEKAAKEKEQFEAEEQGRLKDYRDINMAKVNNRLGRLLRPLKDMAIFKPRSWGLLVPQITSLGIKGRSKADKRAARQRRREESGRATEEVKKLREQIVEEAEIISKRVQETLGEDFGAVDVKSWRRTDVERAKGPGWVTNYPRRHEARLIWRLHRARLGIENKLIAEGTIFHRPTYDAKGRKVHDASTPEQIRAAVAADLRMDSAFRMFREDFDRLRRQEGEAPPPKDERTEGEKLAEPPVPEPSKAEVRAGEAASEIERLHKQLDDANERMQRAKRLYAAANAERPKRQAKVDAILKTIRVIGREMTKIRDRLGTVSKDTAFQQAQDAAGPFQGQGIHERNLRITTLRKLIRDATDDLVAARQQVARLRRAFVQRAPDIQAAEKEVTSLVKDLARFKSELRKAEAIPEEAVELPPDAPVPSAYDVALAKKIGEAENAVELAQKDLEAKERRLANLYAQPRTGGRRPDIKTAREARDASAQTLIERSDALETLKAERKERADEATAGETAKTLGEEGALEALGVRGAERGETAAERVEAETGGGETDVSAFERDTDTGELTGQLEEGSRRYRIGDEPLSEEAGWASVEPGEIDPVVAERYGKRGDAPVDSTASVEVDRALSDIGLASRDPRAKATVGLMQAIVDKFAAVVGRTPIRFMDMADFINQMGRRRAGVFQSYEGPLAGGERGAIFIPRESMAGPYGNTTILHEVAHAATSHAVRQNPELARDITVLGKRLDWFVGEHPEMLDRHGLTARDLKDLESVKEPGEMVAVALSNEGLQRMMIEIQAPPSIRVKYRLSKNASLWDGFINAIARAFKLERAEYSVLDAMLAINDELVAYVPPATAKGGRVSVTDLLGAFAKRGERISGITSEARLDSGEVRAALEKARDRIRHDAPNLFAKARMGLATSRSVVRSLNRFIPVEDLDRGLTAADLWMETRQKMDQERINILQDEFHPAAVEGRRLSDKYSDDWWQTAEEYYADENRMNVYGRKSLAEQTKLARTPGSPAPDNTGRHLSADPNDPRDVQRRANWAGLKERYDELRGPNNERKDLTDWFEKVHDEIFPEDHNQMARENVRNLIEVVEPGVHGDAAAYRLAERIIEGKLSDAEKATYKGTLLEHAVDDARVLRTVKGPWGPMMRFGEHVVQGRYKFDLPAGAQRFDGKGNVDPNGQWLRFDREADRRAFDIKYKDHKTSSHKNVYLDNAGEKLDVTKAEGDKLVADGRATRKYQMKIEDRLVEFHDRKSDAMNSIARWREQIDAGHNLELFGAEPRQYTVEDIGRSYLDQPYQRALAEMERSPGWDGMSKKEQAALRHLMIEVGLRALGSTRIQSKRIKRKTVAGASTDFLRTFGQFATSTSGYRAHLRHMRDVNKYLKTLRDYAHDNRNQTDDVTYPRRALINELHERSDVRDLHARKGFDAAANNVVQRILQVTNAYRLGLSPAYHITNLLEPEMATMPILGHRFGFGKAHVAMRAAERALGMRETLLQGGRQTWGALRRNERGADFNRPLIDRVRAAVGDERADMLLEAEQLGHMQRNAGMEFHEQVMPSERWHERAIDWADNSARQFTMAVEAVNRAKVLLASYDLARADGMTHEQAKKYAFDTNIDSMGDFSSWNTAPLLQKTAMKPGFQFKKYALKTYELMGHMIAAARAADKAEGRTMPGISKNWQPLRQLMLRHAIMAGVNGLPLEPIRAAMIIAGFAGSGYTYEDLENDMRKLVAETFGKDMAEVVSGGVPRFLGVDFSQRMNLSQLLTPFDPRSYESKELSGYLGKIILGAPGDQAANYVKAVQSLVDGKVWDFVERMGPFKAVHDTLVATENWAKGGAETETGKKRASPPDFFDTLLTAAGFQSGTMAEEQDLRQNLLREKKRRGDQRTSITEDYVNAETQAERDAAWQRAQDYNEGKIGSERMTRGVLEKSRRSRAKADREDIFGVSLGGRDRSLRSIPEYYNLRSP